MLARRPPIMRIPPPALLLVAVLSSLVAGSTLVAQETRVPPDVKGAAEEEQVKTQEQIKAEMDGDAAAGQVDVGDPMAVHPVSLTNLAFAHVTTRPRRLAPGESGALLIVLALHTPAVVPGEAAVTLSYEPSQQPVRLGTYVVEPPKPGTLETRFKGRLVHDNTVTIEIPISIDPEAKPGEVPVALNLKTTLSNGATGVAMGELNLPIPGKVKLGRTVPRPIPRDDGSSTVGSVAPTATGMVPVARPESAAAVPAPEARRPADAATMTATNPDGVALEVDFGQVTTLPLGSSVTADVMLHVPNGKWLVRDAASDLVLEVHGADAGVSVDIPAWDEPVQEQTGAGSAKVSRDLSLPVTLHAEPDAASGLRDLEFRLTYRTVDSEASPSSPQVLNVRAVLSVGAEPTVASPWLFYMGGFALALLLGLIVVRAMRR